MLKKKVEKIEYKAKQAGWIISADAQKAMDEYCGGDAKKIKKKGEIASAAILYFLERERAVNLEELDIESQHALDIRLDEIEREQQLLRERIIKCEFNMSKKRDKAISALVGIGIDDVDDLKDLTDEEVEVLEQIMPSMRDWAFFIKWQEEAIEKAFDND